MAAGLIFAACGSDEATPAASEAPAAEAPAATDAPAGEAPAEEAPAEEAPASGALAIEGDVVVAAGTTLALGDCPDDWSATQGVDGDEIRIGQTSPLSGALAAFGAIGGGMEMYFDFINDTDPIDGKELVLIAKDDGYEAGRAVANVEEMIDSDDVFALAHNIGTPINFAIRPITDEACVPQLFNSSGFPFWGDPGNFPWTVGNILNYVTETEIWCADVKANIGDNATVAALIMNNDFGKTYQQTLNGSDACAGLDVVSEQVHDPAGADVTNEMTTLIATGADVFLVGTTSKFCSQSTAVLAASEWRPTTYMSYTCNNLSSFFVPVQDAVETLAADDAGPIMANSNKICGDPVWADDPKMIEVERILNEYGDVTCADGSYSTGILYGELVVDSLRRAAAMDGGLNRVNLMAAVWNTDATNDTFLGGTYALDGANDAYVTESAQLQRVTILDGSLVFESIGDLVNFEGKGGAFGS